jgi:hypothetical protein
VGSVRNPVGPLPSSIYWRRRAVLLCLLALVIAIVVWAVTSGGGGSGKGHSAPTGSHTPAASITPGPEPTGTHIGGRPGGRDTSPPDQGSANGGSGDAGSTGGNPTSGATGTGSDAGSTAAGGTGGPGGSGTGGVGGSSGGGAPLPVGSTLPTCDPGAVQLSLSSVSNSYAPGDTPAFQLRAANSGGTACKIDFGPRQAVFTVTGSDNHHVWASDDCPAGGSYLLQVPGHSSTTFTLRWNEKTSSPKCASPKGAQAPAGTYLVQAKLPGYAEKQASFVLSAD